MIAVPETSALLEEKWDFIFFTGSPEIGKIIHQAAAKNLEFETAAALRDFLLWAIDEAHGNDQKTLDPLHFASLPEYVRALSDAQIRKIAGP